MSLYDTWTQITQTMQTPKQQQAFWDDYFEQETRVYQKILEGPTSHYEGTEKEIAERLGMDPVVFCGFIDGINTSLMNEIDLSSLETDTPITLDIDFEKLYFNMNDAKAKWLYTLPEWEGVLPAEKREEITREWRASKQAIAAKTPGRNDPCPCGSGKKYKKCCGKSA